MKIVRRLDVFPALNELNKLTLPATPKYCVGKALRTLAPHVKYFEDESNAALQTFAKRRTDVIQAQIDATGSTPELKEALAASVNMFDFPDTDSLKSYNEAMLAIQNEDRDVTLHTVSITSFNNIDIPNAKNPQGMEYSPMAILQDDFIID